MARRSRGSGRRKDRRSLVTKLHDLVVRKYLSTIAAMTNDWRQCIVTDVRGRPRMAKNKWEAAKNHPQSWTFMRSNLLNATIFEISPSAYVAMAIAADKHTTEKVAGLEWYKEGLPEDGFGGVGFGEHAREEWEHLSLSILRVGRRLQFPNWLPSDACYLGYGVGIGLTKKQMPLYGLDPDDVERARIYSHLITKTGYVWTLIEAHTEVDGIPGGPIGLVHLVVERVPDYGWTNAISLNPWILPGLIHAIASHGSTIIESEHSLATRLWSDRVRRRSKLNHLVPPPYYMVTMRNEAIRQGARYGFPRLGKCFEFQHQFKVVGHECCKIRRGSIPLDPKLRRSMERRKYHVYELGNPSPEDQKRLQERGISDKESDEWLAILTWKRNEFVKGPAGAPFVPSTRRPLRLARDPTLNVVDMPDRSQPVGSMDTSKSELVRLVPTT